MNQISRRQIHLVLLILLVNIGVTIFFSFIEDPTVNTFSMTGSRYGDINNSYFILWAVMYGTTTFVLLRKIITIYEDKPDSKVKLLLHNSILLVVISIVPARLNLALLRWIHIGLSAIYAVISVYLIHPYARKSFRGTMMRIPMFIWLMFIWVGAGVIYFKYGHNSIYQIWYLTNVPLFVTVIYFYSCYKLSKNGKCNMEAMQSDQSVYLILLLAFNILLTVLYGNIKNPNLYTLSMIGNLFDPVYYLIFLFWGVVYAVTTYIVLIVLFEKNQYVDRNKGWILLVSFVTLVVTVLVPANPDRTFLHGLHVGFSIAYVLIFSYGFHPFIKHMTRQNIVLKRFYILWLLISWLGSLVIFFIYGNTGIYEMWFFINVPLMLISLVVYTMFKRRRIDNSSMNDFQQKIDFINKY